MMKFNYGKIFLLGFGFFGISIIWGVYNAFVPLFLANTFLLAPVVIGFFMTLDNFVALIIQPPVGAWSDRVRSPVGRRIPFILIGAPLSAIAFSLIPVMAGLEILPLFVLCTSVLLFTMAFWRTPAVALMPDITPSEKRSPANGIINLMGGIGAIISFLAGAALYKINPAFPFWLGSILVVIAGLLVFLFIREPKMEAGEAKKPDDEHKPGMLESLKQILQDPDRSALRLLLAIFFWFIAYNAVEAFFTLYANKHLGLEEAEGPRLLGQLSLFFVLFAIPAGAIGARFGRRLTIMSGIALMGLVLIAIFILPVSTLIIPLTKLPLLGVIPVIGIFLMIAGIAWALININSLPMVVDMTVPEKIGTYTGLYYLFSTLAAIAGPNINGLMIQLFDNNYNIIMILAPISLTVAFFLMSGVRRGEAIKDAGSTIAPEGAIP
jgi:Na+/melibiose symporter-like transporter